ncbi:response regulator transcription factor [Paludibacterium paludis]|uniref:DNA-binding response regulator n=1 Tax=Paludibacterium paludis TaxID=1225769 RepID=A0A918P5E7_9NEIS|nr:response regulator transcription factor [Paludibacterium paludis]GGY21760.1 DNA-binding response regulator [Paludibacterium paludis]
MTRPQSAISSAIAIVDPHPLIRYALVCLFRERGFHGVAESNDPAGLDSVLSGPPALILLGGAQTPGLCRALSARYPGARVVPLRFGAGPGNGITLDQDPADLFAALRERAPCLARVGRPPLTPRQQDVLRLLLSGKRNKEIARELGMSAGTAKNHVAGLLRSFSVDTRSRLISLLAGAKTLSAAHSQRNVSVVE